MTETKEIRAEDAAELVTYTGWACKTCGHFWRDDERMARYCCATDFPCECGGRYPKGEGCCQECRLKERQEAWNDREIVEWDGTFPIADLDSEEFIWCMNQMICWIGDRSSGLNDAWLVPCYPDNGREFEMDDFLCDHTGEDGCMADTRDIDKIVNDWIEKNSPHCWHMQEKKRLCLKSVVARTGHIPPAP